MHIVKETPSLKVATKIAASGFCQPISAALEKDVANHLGGGDIVYTILDDDKRAVGFAIFNEFGQHREILYLAGVILDGEHQGREIVSKTVNRARIDFGRACYLALRTQSLRMWMAGKKICTSWYPENMGNLTDSLREVGQDVSQKVGSDFPIGIGVYGGPLYGEKPNHMDPELQEWWDGICDFERGDAVICVGTLPRTEGRHPIMESWSNYF